MPKQSQYYYWDDKERIQLLKLVKQVSRDKTYIDWGYVSDNLQPRTKQQCKSYYRILLAKNQVDIIDEKDSISINDQKIQQINLNTIELEYKVMPTHEKIKIYAYCKFFNNDYAYVARVIFTQYTAKHLEQLFILAQQTMLLIDNQYPNILNNINLQDIPLNRLLMSHDDLITLMHHLRNHGLYKGDIPQPLQNYTDITQDLPPQVMLCYLQNTSRSKHPEIALKNMRNEIERRKAQ
ncbi:Myb-like_DNA-binding domain-containing protein [Hexamita inflata]|uniref:Myb-like DNA-binding domain-containing protein n=1 Tax=Hexamita inflata TaxID=28002 RepID=A0AA86TS85_9EUKA|nr:Myb-like DNA-binding domain-containing protein [Hexamita inflata]